MLSKVTEGDLLLISLLGAFQGWFSKLGKIACSLTGNFISYVLQKMLRRLPFQSQHTRPGKLSACPVSSAEQSIYSINNIEMLHLLHRHKRAGAESAGPGTPLHRRAK